MTEKMHVVMKQYNISVPEPPEFMQNITGFQFGGNETRRGVMARQRGLRPKHPVVIIPGADAGFEFDAGFWVLTLNLNLKPQNPQHGLCSALGYGCCALSGCMHSQPRDLFATTLGLRRR